MKIVFITPTTGLRRFPVYRAGGKLYGQPNSITGPLILGGILKRAGHDVSVYEELNGGVPYKRLLKDTDVFCLCIMTSTAPRGYELADMIHENSDARVLIGGFHATALPDEAAQHADQVITGEGEKVILDVVEGRIKDKIVTGIPICNLDEVPYPDYSILKTPVEAANVISTRGCPFRCTFCTTSRMYQPYRERSIDNVIEEIRMYKNMGFKYMNFEDDNFTANNHIEEVQGVYVPFWLYTGTVKASASFDAMNMRTWSDSKNQYTDTDHFDLYREGTMKFQGVPVDGSTKMPDAHMDAIEPFDYSEMVPFSVAYLPGYITDRYDLDVRECDDRATRRVSNTALEEMEGTASGYMEIHTSSHSEKVTWTHIAYALLPVWMLHTKWNGTDYLFAMNGQTGKLIGDLPIDKGKKTKRFLMLFLPIMIILAVAIFSVFGIF